MMLSTGAHIRGWDYQWFALNLSKWMGLHICELKCNDLMYTELFKISNLLVTFDTHSIIHTPMFYILSHLFNQWLTKLKLDLDSYKFVYRNVSHRNNHLKKILSNLIISGAVAERLRHRSRDQKVPSFGISVEVSSQCSFP